MIDDKKIAEAAKQHSEESYISDYFQAYYKDAFIEDAKWMQEEFLKDLWYPAKEVPNYEEWILTEWYDVDEKEYKYEIDFGTPSVNWNEYVKRNNITKWCYIKDIKD